MPVKRRWAAGWRPKETHFVSAAAYESGLIEPILMNGRIGFVDSVRYAVSDVPQLAYRWGTNRVQQRWAHQ